MTLQNPTNVKTYTGNGVTTVWPYDFLIPGDTTTDQSNVEVTLLVIATGVEGDPLADNLWSITGVGEDTFGNVTYTGGGTPLPATHKINIRRVVPYEQTLDLTIQSAYFPNLLEEALDLIVMQIQQLAEESSRSVQIAIGSSQTPEELIDSLLEATADAEAAAVAAAAAVISAEAAQSAAETAQSAAEAAQAAAEAAAASIEGIPVGGTSGQVLAKTSGTDYAVAWTDPATSGESQTNALFYELADLKGSIIYFPNGIADAYDSETGVDTATSTNESYDAANDLYSPSSSGTTVTINGNSVTSADLGGVVTLVDRMTAVLNNVTITAVGCNQTAAITMKYKIVKRNSAGNYDVVVDQSHSHPGGGFSDATLSSPYVVPASGNYYLAAANTGSNTAFRPASVASRSDKSGDVTGTGQSGFTESAGQPFAMRYTHTPTPNNMTLVSDAFTATAVPATARIAVFIDPQESITINTDFTAEVSRDGGTTWTAITLALVSNPVGTVEQYEGTVSIAAQPSGSSMKYRLKTLNNKDIDVTGVLFGFE